MGLSESVVAALRNSSPASLYQLGATLRERLADAPQAERPALSIALEVCAGYYTFLSSVQAKMTAEGYNKLASLLDLGAVGTVALQSLLAERENLLQKLAIGSVGESLMLIGSLQYIKAWEREAQALHEQAAWQLYDALWDISSQSQPELAGRERRQFIEVLLSPCCDAELKATHKTIYVGWLFQLVLLTALSQCNLFG